ncbi:MAG: hypothetical protein AAGD09_24810, partial [Cyanobacteria bacterium P01_F01_bin.56]
WQSTTAQSPLLSRSDLVASMPPSPSLWGTALGRRQGQDASHGRFDAYRVIYGILKSGQPFDPDKLLPRST